MIKPRIDEFMKMSVNPMPNESMNLRVCMIVKSWIATWALTKSMNLPVRPPIFWFAKNSLSLDKSDLRVLSRSDWATADSWMISD